MIRELFMRAVRNESWGQMQTLLNLSARHVGLILDCSTLSIRDFPNGGLNLILEGLGFQLIPDDILRTVGERADMFQIMREWGLGRELRDDHPAEWRLSMGL
jgi:hypothetical protein